MKRQPRETGSSGLTAKVIKRLKQFPNSFVLKLHGAGFQRAGVPDVLFIYKDITLWFETKRLGQSMTPLQKRTMKQIRTAGNGAYVIYDLSDLEMALRCWKLLT